MATIKDVRDALLTLDIPVYHFVAPEQKPDEFVIWGETAIDTVLDADDEPQIMRPRGSIYYYTATEYDATLNDMLNALMEYDIAFAVVNIGRDFDLRLLTYQIDWSVDCGPSEIY
jgi:hypothetical protein